MLFRQVKFYLFCGGISTTLDFSIYFSLVKAGSNIDLAKGFSFMVATALSYVLNKRITFQSHKRAFSEFINFYLAHALAMLVDVGCNRIFLNLLQILTHDQHRLGLAFTLATACSVVVNFLSQKFWVFRK